MPETTRFDRTAPATLDALRALAQRVPVLNEGMTRFGEALLALRLTDHQAIRSRRRTYRSYRPELAPPRADQPTAKSHPGLFGSPR